MRGSALILGALASPAAAAPTIDPVFGDHAVIQRDRPVVVTGSAAPGESVRVTIGSRAAAARAGGDGRYVVTLPAPASPGPLAIEVTARSGTARASDVLVGDVFLCSGQSNMEMTVDRAQDGYNQVQTSADPDLRLMTVERATSATPRTTFAKPPAWVAATPATVAPFSAACFYMAQELRRSAKVPVGAIAASWGGTRISAWMGEAALRRAGEPPDAPASSEPGPGKIYNGMIAPLGRLGLKGVAWYQGESDAGIAGYRDRLVAMMADWRHALGQSALPFAVVQLAGYGAPTTVPGESNSARVRDDQRLAVAVDGHAAIATAVDLGDPLDIHPGEKHEVGRRLARAMRALAYGDAAPASGPTIAEAFTRADGGVALRFTGVTGALATRGGAAAIGFELCGPGADTCRFALGTVAGDRVVLPADGRPVTRVRYAWADSPTLNLYDAAPLPAGPFEIAVARDPARP